MLLHINGKFTMGKLKSSLVVKFRSQPVLTVKSRFRSRYEAEQAISVDSFISSLMG